MSKQHSTKVETTTHVAGCGIQVYDRVIQRCLICGEKLADSNDPDFKTIWKEGELIRSKYGFLYSTEREYLSIAKLPKDSCLQLVEM